MTPTYIGYFFRLEPVQPLAEILIAQLNELGFDSFVETETGLEAYIEKSLHQPKDVEELYVFQNPDFKIDYEVKEIEQVNWNEEWERNFKPILVDDICQIRAPFHAKQETTYDIIIEPKMSFGTGHHATTHMMVQHLLQLDCTNKVVLDMGCGTGILAILAGMRGATDITAIDIDHWCYLNTQENVVRNNYPAIKVFEGDASLLGPKKFDLIIANINRNILLQDLPIYEKVLLQEGIILLSGFYIEDLSLIKEKCNQLGLQYVNHHIKDNWVGAKFVKN